MSVSALVLVGQQHLDPGRPVTNGLDEPEGLVLGVVSILGWQRKNELGSA
jgi:hypothetical protein